MSGGPVRVRPGIRILRNELKGASRPLKKLIGSFDAAAGMNECVNAVEVTLGSGTEPKRHFLRLLANLRPLR